MIRAEYLLYFIMTGLNYIAIMYRYLIIYYTKYNF